MLKRPDGQKFALSGPTQIGRAFPDQKDEWAVPEREKPGIFDNLEAFIRTPQGNNLVSRNHAGILLTLTVSMGLLSMTKTLTLIKVTPNLGSYIQEIIFT